MKPITSEALFHEALALDRALLFKHSPICNVSDNAMRHMERFRAGHADLPVYIVDVVHDRPLSRKIESHCGVRHQSPQVLLLENGEVVWHDSHFRITEESLVKHVVSRAD